MTLFKKAEPLEKGTMLFSGKALLTLIVPLFVQQVLNVAVGTADSIMVASAGEAAVSGVSLINTLTGMAIDIERRRPIIANNTGGVSGAGVKPIAVRMTYEAAQAVKIPVIGMGGITCAEDAIEFLMAGATAVQVGAANLVDPFVCKKIIEDLPAVMKKYRIENLSDIIGGAHHG